MNKCMRQLVFILLGVLIALVFTTQVHAQARSCQLVYQLAEELRCSLPGGPGGAWAQPTPTSPTDFIVSASYGPSQCKIADALKAAQKELREECNAWIKERKDDLKSKYQTGTCQDDCQDCGGGLKNCTVRGVVHYTK